MALVSCPDCARQISDIAPTCPQCGRPSAAERRRLAWYLPRRLGWFAILAASAAVFYTIHHASALGVPTLTPLAYNGSLMTFGAPDNATHTMTLGLFVAGSNDGGINSAACTTTVSVTCVNGQFTIPLSPSCVTVVQQNPNIQAEVIVDNVPMGLIGVSAVPYAIEAGGVAASAVSGVLPVTSGGTGASTENFVDLSTAQTIGGAKTFSSPLVVQAIAQATTPPAGDNSTSLATTAFIQNLFSGNQVLGPPGYLRLPGGLILEWGTWSCTTGGVITSGWSEGFATYTLPLAFPTAPLFTIGNPNDDPNTIGERGTAPNPTTTTITINCGALEASQTLNGQWLALGH